MTTGILATNFTNWREKERELFSVYPPIYIGAFVKILLYISRYAVHVSNS